MTGGKPKITPIPRLQVAVLIRFLGEVDRSLGLFSWSGDGPLLYTQLMSVATRIQPEESYEAELFDWNGRQAVRLPDGIHLEGKTVKLHRVGNSILLEPKPVVPERKRTAEELRLMFEYIDSIEADPLFPEGRNQGVAEERLPFD